MQAMINFFVSIINKIYEVLSFHPFPDLPMSYIEFIMTIVIIRYLFTFIFGGTREFTMFSNFTIRDFSRPISHQKRQDELVKNSSRIVPLNGNRNNYRRNYSPVPGWLNKEIAEEPMDPIEKARLEAMLAEFK